MNTTAHAIAPRPVRPMPMRGGSYTFRPPVPRGPTPGQLIAAQNTWARTTPGVLGASMGGQGLTPELEWDTMFPHTDRTGFRPAGPSDQHPVDNARAAGIAGAGAGMLTDPFTAAAGAALLARNAGNRAGGAPRRAPGAAPAQPAQPTRAPGQPPAAPSAAPVGPPPGQIPPSQRPAAPPSGPRPSDQIKTPADLSAAVADIFRGAPSGSGPANPGQSSRQLSIDGSTAPIWGGGSRGLDGISGPSQTPRQLSVDGSTPPIWGGNSRGGPGNSASGGNSTSGAGAGGGSSSPTQPSRQFSMDGSTPPIWGSDTRGGGPGAPYVFDPAKATSGMSDPNTGMSGPNTPAQTPPSAANLTSSQSPATPASGALSATVAQPPPPAGAASGAQNGAQAAEDSD